MSAHHIRFTLFFNDRISTDLMFDLKSSDGASYILDLARSQDRVRIRHEKEEWNVYRRIDAGMDYWTIEHNELKHICNLWGSVTEEVLSIIDNLPKVKMKRWHVLRGPNEFTLATPPRVFGSRT